MSVDSRPGQEFLGELGARKSAKGAPGGNLDWPFHAVKLEAGELSHSRGFKSGYYWYYFVSPRTTVADDK